MQRRGMFLAPTALAWALAAATAYHRQPCVLVPEGAQFRGGYMLIRVGDFGHRPWRIISTHDEAAVFSECRSLGLENECCSHCSG